MQRRNSLTALWVNHIARSKRSWPSLQALNRTLLRLQFASRGLKCLELLVQDTRRKWSFAMHDQNNVFYAIALSVVILISWQYFFATSFLG